MIYIVFFFNDTATTEIYTLSLHDALPIFGNLAAAQADINTIRVKSGGLAPRSYGSTAQALDDLLRQKRYRSEEHTSELQSRQYLVCRLLLEKKKKHQI